VTLTLGSPALTPGQQIPSLFSFDGGNVSPPLEWQGAPPETRSFALIVEDLDAPDGVFHHWALYDIAPNVSGLADGAGSERAAAPFATGRNDFGHRHYDGPRPSAGGGTHHYRFRLFALDVPALELPLEATAADVRAAALEHAIAEAEIVAMFELPQPADGENNVGSHYRPAPARTRDTGGRTTPEPEPPPRNTPPAGKWNDITS
jgi:Raf kinase inhibitor-like YbhB/YbcL family protein